MRLDEIAGFDSTIRPGGGSHGSSAGNRLRSAPDFYDGLPFVALAAPPTASVMTTGPDRPSHPAGMGQVSYQLGGQLRM